MKILALLGFILLLPASLHARTWVVDNDTTRPADFRSAQAAHDGAAAGDTLLFVGSGASYGELTITKLLHFVGPGYNLLENNIPSANQGKAFIGIGLKSSGPQGSGASGSTFQGMDLGGMTMIIDPGISDVTFDKCSLPGIECGGRTHGGNTGNGQSVQNLLIKRSLVGSDFRITGGSAVILNSKIGAISVHVLEYGANNANRALASLSLNQCVLANGNGFIDVPTLPDGVSHSNLSITNSIIFSAIPAQAGLQVSSSLLYQNAGNHPGNAAFTDSNAIFTFASPKHPSTPPATEKEFQLNTDPSNPAIGTALGGGDMGLFGGAQLYRLSGVPAVPRVTHLSTSGVASDTVGLTLNVGGEIRE